MEWDFEARLKRALDKVGWSQTVLASRSGLHPVHINKLLHGRKKRVEAETIRKLAMALNVTTDYLLGLEDDEADIECARSSIEYATRRVIDHIDTHYPAMWKGVPKTARTSLRNMIRIQTHGVCQTVLERDFPLAEPDETEVLAD